MVEGATWWTIVVEFGGSGENLRKDAGREVMASVGTAGTGR